MARAIERIERDILAIEEAIQAIAQELQSAYTSYLTTLGQAVRQQLILASYHLCTQGYPENFLSLSLNQRQQLQQAIRKLGQQTAEQLQTLTRSEEEKLADGVETLREWDNGALETLEGGKDVEPDSPHPPTLEGTPKPPIIEQSDASPFNKSSPRTYLAPQFREPFRHRLEGFPSGSHAHHSAASASPDLLTPNPSNPIELAKWQQNLEKRTQDRLKTVSREANLLLQKAGVLPKKLPEPILEAAASASEASAEVMPGPPNLLNLVIEIENGQHSEDSNLTQIMAINLRLGEIEFADATLSSERKQIRNILIQLNRLGQEYQKKQRERSIAEAEAVWRASWFED